ncbi:GlxA family transcriptional regulator [Sinomicrobium sp. M5D2P17]
MKKVSLLVYEDAVLSALSGAVDIFTGTNRFMESMGDTAPFELELVSEKAGDIRLFAPASFICRKTLVESENTDLIIVPAFNGDAAEVLEKNKALVEWIRQMSEKGSEVASLCFGSYFLAEAGLLSGKPCTSHWLAIPGMKMRYQDIDLMPDMVITDREGIYTSGGAFSSLNLILYLVEKFCGREIGIQVSKMFSIDMDRVNQAHFSVFQGQHQHEDKEILRIQKYIEENYNAQVSVEDIAEKANMSKRNFVRRFKNATQNTPLEYLQRVKIEAAKKALERSAESIHSVVYDVGYNDLKTFRKIFKRVTGLTPQDYRRKYSRA